MCGETKGQLVVGWWGFRSEEGPPGVQVLLLYSWDPDRVSDLSRSESPGLHNTTSRPKGGGMKKKLKLVCLLKQTCALLLYLLQNAGPNPIQPFCWWASLPELPEAGPRPVNAAFHCLCQAGLQASMGLSSVFCFGQGSSMRKGQAQPPHLPSNPPASWG